MSLETDGKPQRENDIEKKQAPIEWGAKTRFGTGQQQPSSEAKKAGWARKKRNRKLAQLLLQRAYAGKVKKGQVIVDSKFRTRLKDYFGLGEDELEEVTNEAAIMLRMIGEAQENGNVYAAQMMLERAYGKPKDYNPIDEEEDDNSKPQIVINVIQQLELPPIKENEDDNI